MTWLARQEGGDSRKPAPLGPHLYDGTSGVALFLGAYHHVTGSEEARDLALRAIAPLRARITQLATEPEQASRRALAIGGLTGLGSFLYVFTRLAGWLREPRLYAAARAAAALITPERIRADRRLDVLAGCAGTLLALLAFHRERPAGDLSGPEPLELARACGRHLLASRVAFEGRPLAWPGEDRPPLSGFSHGAAGIGHALLRLYQASGEVELRAAACEGFAFERSLYDPRARNWLDPRFGRLLEQSAWCHGAPGIALGRLQARKLTEDGAVHKDLDQALALTVALPESPVDYPCCGNCGRIDILWSAGEVLGRPELSEAAWDLAERVLARAGDGFALTPGESEDSEPPPSFFLGLAGVGYTLLRMTAPDLPSVLLLE